MMQALQGRQTTESPTRFCRSFRAANQRGGFPQADAWGYDLSPSWG